MHIRFDADDEDLPDAAPAPTVEEPPTPSLQGPALLPRCCCSVRVDANRGNPSYVFRTLANSAHDAVAASTSDNLIKAYALSSAQLAPVCDLRGHNGTISDMAFTGDGVSTLHSSSADGSVRGWDLRGGRQTESFTTSQELYSFDVLDHLVAAGGQGEVFFWDRRAPGRTLATLPDTHMDEVTQNSPLPAALPPQVKLHSTQHAITASTDGLVAVHDLSRGVTDDDENFAAALNVGTSVEELGLYGRDGHKLWVRTGTETLHLWEWRVATLSDRDGGHGAFTAWPEARAEAAAKAAGGPVASLFEEVGYLVCCHYDAASDGLVLVAGTPEGAVGFWPLQEQPGTERGAVMQPPAMALQGAHSEVVRSVHCFRSSTTDPFCVSGGEDGRVCLWSLNPSSASSVGTSGAVGSAALAPAAGPSGFAGPSGGQGFGAAGGAGSSGSGMQESAGPSRKEGGRHLGAASKQYRKHAPY